MNLYNNFFSFLEKAKTPYHAVNEVKKALVENGFTEICESENAELTKGGKYFAIRNGSSIIAFKNNGGGFMICASHSDSPAFKVKGELGGGTYLRLNTEKYGGMINYTWLDRPLSVAGRVVLKDGNALSVRLADIGERCVVIPSVAIHFNRTVNDGYKFSLTSDMVPLSGLGSESTLLSVIASSVGAKAEDIVSHDLYLYAADKARYVGTDDELILAPRLDDLGCVYSSLAAFLDSDNKNATPVLAVFDNEEVGSSTKQGAASTFLKDTLMRTCSDEREYRSRIALSFMVSADNAHAIHPNHPELSEKENAPILGGGVVVKYSASGSYTTDAVSDAVFRTVCDKAGVKAQSFRNRPDMPGGSTLGAISDTVVSVPSVDIGLPQLAMHSASETMAKSDLKDMTDALKVYFSSALEIKGNEIKIL